MTRTKKCCALALLSGGLMFQLGCLGGWFNAAIAGLPGTIIAEWLLDNDSVFDLFEDGNVAAAE
jgi:hypothetical protein